MSHSPPVPPGNQSPFPRVEPPHPVPAASIPLAGDDADEPEAPLPSLAISLAAVVGIGAIAAIAGAFFLRSHETDAPKRRRRQTAKTKERGGKAA